jgi:uncharacterized membrane protein YesL
MVQRIFIMMDWLMRLAYLNIVWIFFSLPIITVIPSTFAMFAVIKKWEEEDKDIPVFTTFRTEFVRNFWKSYQLGLFYIFVGTLLYLDYIVIYEQEGSIILIIRYALTVLSILFISTVFYSIPIQLRYEYPWYKTLLFSLMLVIRQPVITILMLCGIVLDVVVFIYWTGIGILFVGSLMAFIVSKSAYAKFKFEQ